jgi:hypothetical protein
VFRNRWVMLIGAVVVMSLVAWGARRGGGGSSAVAVDLIRLLPQADRRSAPSPVEQAIRIVTVTIARESKPCILEQAHGRITFRLTPPQAAWFTASLAVDPSTWDKEGDGVLFRLGVSGKGIEYEELLNQHLNPAANKSERRWIPVAIDLSAWAGREINLILSTNASVPGRTDDLRNDLALWCAPALVSGR